MPWGADGWSLGKDTDSEEAATSLLLAGLQEGRHSMVC